MKFNARLAVGRLLACPLIIFSCSLWAQISDVDGDEVIDLQDNCIEFENPAQIDADLDGYGNRCDPDFNNDGAVNFTDLGYMRSVFFTNDAVADLNGDGAVNFTDLGILRGFMFSPPGPANVDVLEGPPPLVGQFINPTKGLVFEANSFSGVTDEQGRFLYLPGEQVEFSFSGLSLGFAAGNEVVSPLDLVTELGSEVEAGYLAQLLQSLDQNGNIVDGIMLPDTGFSFPQGFNIFDSASIAAFISDLGNTLVPIDIAEQRMYQAIAEATGLDERVIPPGSFENTTLLHFAGIAVPDDEQVFDAVIPECPLEFTSGTLDITDSIFSGTLLDVNNQLHNFGGSIDELKVSSTSVTDLGAWVTLYKPYEYSEYQVLRARLNGPVSESPFKCQTLLRMDRVAGQNIPPRLDFDVDVGIFQAEPFRNMTPIDEAEALREYPTTDFSPPICKGLSVSANDPRAGSVLNNLTVSYTLQDLDGWITEATLAYEAGGRMGTLDLLTRTNDVAPFVESILFGIDIGSNVVSETKRIPEYRAEPSYSGFAGYDELLYPVKWESESNPSYIYGSAILRDLDCELLAGLSELQTNLKLTLTVTDNSGMSSSAVWHYGNDLPPVVQDQFFEVRVDFDNVASPEAYFETPTLGILDTLDNYQTVDFCDVSYNYDVGGNIRFSCGHRGFALEDPVLPGLYRIVVYDEYDIGGKVTVSVSTRGPVSVTLPGEASFDGVIDFSEVSQGGFSFTVN